MTVYITAPEFEARHRLTDAAIKARIPAILAAASRDADRRTGRQFAPHTDNDGDATPRYFKPTNLTLCYVDDCYEISEVAVDWNNTGTYNTVWTTADYQTLPINGIGPDGQTWSTHAIEAFGPTTLFPCTYRRPTVKVTAKWGWASIPDAVREATHLIANRLLLENDVPSGIVAGELGGVPLRRQWTAEDLLRPYVRGDRLAGVA